MECKLKILAILGTRPEVIKLAPVIMELELRPDKFISTVCATAQHREMLDQAIKPFGIEISHDLDIMRPGQDLAQVTARAVDGLSSVIREEQPDIVLVQGDTTTTFCGSLAAFYHKVRVGHVEAGLRTDDKYAPFPEEINRRLVTQIADYHFAPTEYARQSLLDEGIAESAVFMTGNTVIDALLWMRAEVHKKMPELPYGLRESIEGRQTVLVTGHRRESFGEGFENICNAIKEVAETFPEAVFVYPVHLNPNVRGPVDRILSDHKNIHLIGPLAYAPFIWLMDHSDIVLTDSGGVQEEAPALGKPVLVMRDTTERPEGVEAGNAILTGTGREQIVDGLTQLLNNPEKRAAMATVRNPYGDGTAAAKIADILEKCN